MCGWGYCQDRAQLPAWINKSPLLVVCWWNFSPVIVKGMVAMPIDNVFPRFYSGNMPKRDQVGGRWPTEMSTGPKDRARSSALSGFLGFLVSLAPSKSTLFPPLPPS